MFSKLRREMSETVERWLILAGVVFVVLLYRAIRKIGERRRSEHFALLASHCGSTVEVKSETSQRFRAERADRMLEVRDEYRGGGLGDSSTGSRYITIGTKLRGRAWDLHSVGIRRRLGRSLTDPFEKAIKVEDLGMPMREGWLTPDVRAALTASFGAAHRLGTINIEGGELFYREAGSPRMFSPEALLKLIDRLVELAAAVERAR